MANVTNDLPAIANGLPNICGTESVIEDAIRSAIDCPVALGASRADLLRIRSSFAIALHMHQPLIPAGGADPHNAELISNLRQMMESASDEQRYNAGIFRWCYQRMGEFIPQLVGEGKQPGVMLDYSGTLLWGLQQMGLDEVLGNLRTITCEPRYRGCVEWLGSAWGHPVAPSTPVQDYRLHVRAWQHHFAALFGLVALTRVRGFSPAEMALPNHPDVAYEFVRTLKECGYRWVLVQEHTVERPDTGAGPDRKYLPHRLLCRNSHGETAEIIAIIKTQGSDTKLVAQMQPYNEARGLSHWDLAGRPVPPLVMQIADGENGGVMMNDFPAKYIEVVRECSASETPLVNVSEYLDHLFAMGVRIADMPLLQPVLQSRIWERFKPGDGAKKLAEVIEQLQKEDSRFQVEGASWTNSISWVRGYERLVGPMEELSSLFYEKVLKPGLPTGEPRYRRALLHLLVSQTSCYRYWGQGIFVDYGREICRRGRETLIRDF
ncbi:MAG: glycosyl hydrolase family 57 [Steroidobacteraceae bacterium]|jgi:glycosyl hydrolase family 57